MASCVVPLSLTIEAVAALVDASINLLKLAFINRTLLPTGKFPAKVIDFSCSLILNIVLTRLLLSSSIFTDKGKSNAEPGNSLRYGPKYSLYKSRALLPSNSYNTFFSLLVTKRSLPNSSHPPKELCPTQILLP